MPPDKTNADREHFSDGYEQNNARQAPEIDDKIIKNELNTPRTHQGFTCNTQ